MDKFSQFNLLEEGFLDAIRLAGKAARGVVRTANAIDTQGFKAIKTPINKFIDSKSKITDPKKFVEQELKSSYYKTFNPKSVKIIEVKKDTNRFIVSFSAERFLPTGGSAPSEIYYAYVFKGGEKNELSMDVRDDKGNQIQGEKGKKTEKPDFNTIIKQYQTRGTPITVALLSTIITKKLGISERDYAKKLSPGATDMDAAIMDITNKSAVQDVLEQDDIDKVYQVLHTRGLAEKVKASQKVLLEQLKSLS